MKQVGVPCHFTFRDRIYIHSTRPHFVPGPIFYSCIFQTSTRELIRPSPPPLPPPPELVLHVDDLLPRVVELATGSMEYREKAAACELLEAVLKLCVGLNATDPDPNGAARDMSALYARLFPACLSLAVDADGFSRALFERLSLQASRRAHPQAFRKAHVTPPRLQISHDSSCQVDTHTCAYPRA